jgi:hypothetical protein
MNIWNECGSLREFQKAFLKQHMETLDFFHFGLNKAPNGILSFRTYRERFEGPMGPSIDTCEKWGHDCPNMVLALARYPSGTSTVIVSYIIKIDSIDGD